MYYQRVEGPDPTKHSYMAMNLADHTERELYRMPLDRFSVPEISPDGKNLVFVENTPESLKEGQYLLTLLPTAGGAPRVLAEGPIRPDYLTLTWAKDGESVLYTLRGNELWRVSIRTGEKSLVATYPSENSMRLGRLSPDGRQKVRPFGGGNTYEVWGLENFLPKPTAGQ